MEMMQSSPLLHLFPPYAELATKSWWLKICDYLNDSNPSWELIKTNLQNNNLYDARAGFALGKCLDLYQRNIISFESNNFFSKHINDSLLNGLHLYFEKTITNQVSNNHILLFWFLDWLHHLSWNYSIKELNWWKTRLVVPIWWWDLLYKSEKSYVYTVTEWTLKRSLFELSVNPADFFKNENIKLIDIHDIMCS